jgi:hypothetical protein
MVKIGTGREPGKPSRAVTFDDWLEFIERQDREVAASDPWRGQPPHQALFLLLIDGPFMRRLGVALLGLIAAAVVAALQDRVPPWLPWWVPFSGGALAGIDALRRGLAERADCRDQFRRIREAELAVASLVMANHALFDRASRDDLPGVVVATLDPQLKRDPGRLAHIASQLYATKGKPADRVSPELRQISAVLTDESGRFNPFKIPTSICGNDATWLSSCWFFREQLVGGVIDRRIFPVLAQRADPRPARSIPKLQWCRSDFDAALKDEFCIAEGGA